MGKPRKTPKKKRKYTRKTNVAPQNDEQLRKSLKTASEGKTESGVPNIIIPVADNPTTPAVIEPDNTPLTALDRLTAFLEAWKVSDWKAMSDCCQLTWLETGHPACTAEGWLEIVFGHKILKSYKILPEPEEVRDWGYMLAFDVKAKIVNNANLKAQMKINVVFESVPQEPEKDMDSKTGEWGVNPISAMNIQWDK